MTEKRMAQWERFCALMAPEQQELERRAALCRELWPEDCALALKTSDELREDTFLFQLPWDMEQTYQPVHFDNGIDWGYILNGDGEFTFQMNRHRYWISLGQAYALTGNEAYAECFVRQLLDWLDKEPWREEAGSTTWRTLDAGLRADYWVRAMALCAHSPAVTPEVAERFLDGLEAHAVRLGTNPRTGFSKKSNWGVMEYTGLYVIAWILDRPADLERARFFLKEALHTQIMDDGMQWEASPMYHNEVPASYLEVLRVADIWNDELFDGEELDLIRRAAFATMNLQTPAHHQPMVGDSDDTDVRDLLSEAALLYEDGELKAGAFERLDFESIWLFGAEGDRRYQAIPTIPSEEHVTELSDSGQVVLRSGWDAHADWLYFKNGPLGGGHGHQDKLHVSLWLGGEEVLTDCGRFTYTDTPMRYELKSSAMHNVPMIGKEEYSDSADSWIYQALPQAMPNRVCRKGEFFFAEGSHTGYAEKGVLVCRRVVSIGMDVFLINDSWIGPQPEEVSQRFHFGENITLTPEEQGVAGAGRACRFSMRTFAQGKAVLPELETAPIARHYNLLDETAALTARAARCSAMTTVIVRRRTGSPVRVIPQTVDNDAYLHALTEQEAEGYQIEADGRRYAVVFLHHDVGNTEDHNGICGVYGLGRTMVCDLDKTPQRMTVLQW